MTSKIDTKKTPRAAGQLNPSFTPYFSQSYVPPQHVLDLFPEPVHTFTTPSFTEGQRSFTSQEQMMAFLHGLNEKTDYMRMEIIGHSTEGREIPMLVFSKSQSEESEDFKRKPTVWLQAHVHGHEPASGESALVIAYKLAREELGQELLDDINVVIVPRMNPDSVYYFEQLSPTKINGNRDHVNLEMAELQAVHAAFNRYQAEVVIDAHEYEATPAYQGVGEEGALRSHDMLILAGKNLNIPEIIRQKADEWFIQAAFEGLEKEGFSYDHYFTVHPSSHEQVVVKEGGVDAGIGRNAFALKPSFCFLTESVGIGVGRENFLRRVSGQVITHISILRETKKRAADIKKVVEEARKEIIESGKKGKRNGTLVIKSEPMKIEGKKIKAIDIAKGQVIDLPVCYYSMTDSVPIFERVRPNAYLLPPAYHHIIKKLKKQGAVVDKLEHDKELNVECYTVTSKLVDTSGDQTLTRVTTEIKEKTLYFLKGSYLISCAQPTALLVGLALEPESDYSYVTHNYFSVSVGSELPIYRFMENVDLPIKD